MIISFSVKGKQLDLLAFYNVSVHLRKREARAVLGREDVGRATQRELTAFENVFVKFDLCSTSPSYQIHFYSSLQKYKLYKDSSEFLQQYYWHNSIKLP